MRIKEKRRQLIRVPALCAAGLTCLWAAWSILAILADDACSREVISSLRAYVTCDGTAEPNAPEENPEGSGDGSLPAVPEETMRADFDSLRKVNADICGWIRIPGTDISYPIVQGKDNTSYLRRGPDGKESRAGSIFLDAACESDFSGVNSVLYGHRMNNGTMFAALHDYEDAAFGAAHPYICVLTPAGETVYRIFEVSEADAFLSSPAYQTQFADALSIRSWGSLPAGDAPYTFEDAQLDPSDRVLTLSTCVRGDGGRRFIVRAKAVS